MRAVIGWHLGPISWEKNQLFPGHVVLLAQKVQVHFSPVFLIKITSPYPQVTPKVRSRDVLTHFTRLNAHFPGKFRVIPMNSYEIDLFLGRWVCWLNILEVCL